MSPQHLPNPVYNKVNSPPHQLGRCKCRTVGLRDPDHRAGSGPDILNDCSQIVIVNMDCDVGTPRRYSAFKEDELKKRAQRPSNRLRSRSAKTN